MPLKSKNLPLKVGRNENYDQTRINYFLEIFEGNKWETVGIEVFPDGTYETKIKSNCDMPYNSQTE